MDVLVEDYLGTNERSKLVKAQQEAMQTNLNEMLKNAHKVHSETIHDTQTTDRNLGARVI